MDREDQPKPALEVQLKQFGCPYEATDSRTYYWLEGYRAGFNAGGDLAKDTLLRTVLEPGK